MATPIVVGAGTTRLLDRELRYFLNTPNSLVLQGLDSKGLQSKTYGCLNKAATCRQCLEAGQYKYTSVLHNKVRLDIRQPFDTLDRKLQNIIVEALKKRLHHLLNSHEVQQCVANQTNTCAPT